MSKNNLSNMIALSDIAWRRNSVGSFSSLLGREAALIAQLCTSSNTKDIWKKLECMRKNLVSTLCFPLEYDRKFELTAIGMAALTSDHYGSIISNPNIMDTDWWRKQQNLISLQSEFYNTLSKHTTEKNMNQIKQLWQNYYSDLDEAILCHFRGDEENYSFYMASAIDNASKLGKYLDIIVE